MAIIILENYISSPKKKIIKIYTIQHWQRHFISILSSITFAFEKPPVHINENTNVGFVCVWITWHVWIGFTFLCGVLRLFPASIHKCILRLSPTHTVVRHLLIRQYPSKYFYMEYSHATWLSSASNLMTAVFHIGWYLWTGKCICEDHKLLTNHHAHL